MPISNGEVIQREGKTIFINIGLKCCSNLNQTRLLDIDPGGSHSSNEHLEIDYLIPYEGYCLVGEITSRASKRDVERKYQKFRNHFIFLERNISANLWQLLGVPKAMERDFRGITELRGFFISTTLQRFDVNLSKVANVARLFKVDWELLTAYSQSIGSFAKDHFLSRFGAIDPKWHRSLELHQDSHDLMVTKDKRVASGVGLSDVFTFEISPYEVLPIAQVFRRDLLPTLTSAIAMEYQRPLLPHKLEAIRNNLLVDEDFIFPSSILVVLSNDCRYSATDKVLRIPLKYGSISVIDGQHRLFSYANDEVMTRLGNRNRIMVTAIKFHATNIDTVFRHSARTFVEINTNQTPVPRTHLDAIAYDILGETTPRAIAAKVILEANERKGSKLYGLFDTNRTGLGIIQVTTVLMSLKAIMNKEFIDRLQSTRSDRLEIIRRGYENLFGSEIIQFSTPQDLISKGVICLEHYFNCVGSIFYLDWPERGVEKNTSLKFAKMISAFIKLLWKDFLQEGLTWNDVRIELEQIRSNVMRLRNMGKYEEILFDPNHPDIPNADQRDYDHYHFLSENRKEPTSIRDVING